MDDDTQYNLEKYSLAIEQDDLEIARQQIVFILCRARQSEDIDWLLFSYQHLMELEFVLNGIGSGLQIAYDGLDTAIEHNRIEYIKLFLYRIKIISLAHPMVWWYDNVTNSFTINSGTRKVNNETISLGS